MTKMVLRNVCCSYLAGLNAVDNVSLEVKSGEFVSLLGPSGCGKTTTLRLIAGFMQPRSGTIEIDDQIVSSENLCVPPEKRSMSMIFQSYAVWPNMNVSENVGFGLSLKRMRKDEIKERVSQMLKTVQLEHLAHRYPNELSGGQQQRVALARAIIVRPKVLLLDEPLSNLDAKLREEMRMEIRRLHEEFKITSIYVTHDQVEAMTTSDRVVLMNAGRIEQTADPFTLYNSPSTRFAAEFIGRTNILKGRIEGPVIDAGVLVPLPSAEEPWLSAGEVTVSVRPQNIRLLAVNNEKTHRSQQASVVRRSYLGDYWDYDVLITRGEVNLKVMTKPSEIHNVGDEVWIEIDSEHVILVKR